MQIFRTNLLGCSFPVTSADFWLCLRNFCGKADRGRLAGQRWEFKIHRKSTAQAMAGLHPSSSPLCSLHSPHLVFLSSYAHLNGNDETALSQIAHRGCSASDSRSILTGQKPKNCSEKENKRGRASTSEQQSRGHMNAGI